MRINELIAFHDLKKKVIDPGFCTYCAACEAACPLHAIKVRGDKVIYEDCSSFLDQCSVCYNVCPHTESLIFEARSFVEAAPNVREAIGAYRRIVLAQSTDKRVKERAPGGGVVTALLTYAMEKKIIDSAIVSEVKPYSPLKPKPLICLVPDDCLTAVDGQFSPSTVLQAFWDAIHGYGRKRIGFVGLPHQVLAIRKLEAWQHKIAESLTLLIGLFCLWNFSLRQLLEYLEKEYNVKASDIEKISLSETYDVYTPKKTIRIPIFNVLPHVLNGCRMCLDYTSELADLSVGGAHPLKRWSLVIIRTERGEKIFEEAVKDGALRTLEIEEFPKVFANLLSLAMHKKKIALEEATKREKDNQPVMPSLSRLLIRSSIQRNILAERKAEEIMTKEVVTLSPETTINEILELMTKQHHIGYPVVDSDKNLIGIVTFEDISRVPKELRDEISAAELAKRDLVTVNPESSILEVLEKINTFNIGRILVVDPEDNRKLLGIITRTDILRALRRA